MEELTVPFSYSGIIVCITVEHFSNVLQYISKELKEPAHEKQLERKKLYSGLGVTNKGMWYLVCKNWLKNKYI